MDLSPFAALADAPVDIEARLTPSAGHKAVILEISFERSQHGQFGVLDRPRGSVDR